MEAQNRNVHRLSSDPWARQRVVGISCLRHPGNVAISLLKIISANPCPVGVPQRVSGCSHGEVAEHFLHIVRGDLMADEKFPVETCSWPPSSVEQGQRWLLALEKQGADNVHARLALTQAAPRAAIVIGTESDVTAGFA
jgi:hypothetical protein